MSLVTTLTWALPHRLLSSLARRAAYSRNPRLRRWLIGTVVRRFGVDLSEAASPDPESYESFNAFFTRALKDGARPIAPEADDIACPADGTVSQLGRMRGSDVIQAKGQYFSVYELLGGDSALASEFTNGHFATVYLSPRDYHRVHMPVTGTLRKMIYVPGKLFSVNRVTTQQVPRLFARNERAVCIFDTEQGPVAVILVGAMIVAGIETVFAGQVTPHPTEVTHTSYERQAPIVLEKGAELGRFLLGSTVVMLFPEGRCEWAAGLGAESPVKMGQPIGKVARP